MSSLPIGPDWAHRLVLAGCAILAVIGLLPAPVAGTDSPETYEDAAASVHAPAISALETAGIFDGTDCSSGRFCPTAPLPRWVMAVWLVRALDDREPAPTAAPGSFADVDSSVWWAAHVERLAQLGLTEGCSALPPRYCPDGTVTRAQMASFLTRAFDLEPSGSVGFTDTAGNTHQAGIDALAAAGITAGCATNPARYCPDTPVTRAQMATFLARALNLVEIPDSSIAQPVVIAFPDVGLAGMKHIVYERGDQHVWLVQADGTLFDSYPVSGKADKPPPGRYEVFSKSLKTWALSGGVTMEHMVRFYQAPGRAAIGFHSIPVRPDGTPIQTVEELGQFRSIGCVRQRDDKAEQLYEWAPIGTPVVVLA